jgi:hypothetical protein
MINKASTIVFNIFIIYDSFVVFDLNWSRIQKNSKLDVLCKPMIRIEN